MPDKTCKHEEGFVFGPGVFGYPGAWYCSQGCGYWLNFNPDHYPYGVAFLRDQDTPKGKKISLSRNPPG
jgi:hypothetical protein